MASPILSIDMDGVLCHPVTGLNLVISHDIERPLDFSVRRPKKTRALLVQIAESRLAQAVRYEWRRPKPGVQDGLAALARLRQLVLLTGRPESARPATERWLEGHGLRHFFSDLVLNDRNLSNASFKLVVSRERQFREHVDDDGRVAYFLARDNHESVFLIAYRGNAGLAYPPTVQRVRTLLNVAEAIQSRQHRDPAFG